MSPTEPGLGIGQVAQRTGLSVHALRFYEREGLLPEPIQRDPGGRRVYTEHDLEWLDLCIMLRASGMPLPAIRQYTDLVGRGPGNERDRVALLRQHQAQVAAQLVQLSRCHDLITFKIGLYEDLLEAASTHCVVAPQPQNH